jgi:hypothetical protein
VIGAVAALVAAVIAAAFAPPDDAAMDARVKAARQLPSMAEKLTWVSEPFLGAAYAHSPLGEGAGRPPDVDPRLRWDAFDCTTFVETTIALAVADDLAGAKQLLDALRYRDGRVDYLARRHFPESEWIPDLVRLGFLKDVTREIGGKDVVTATKTLDQFVWGRAQRHKGTPSLPAERVPQGTFTIDAWALAAAMAHPEKIPPGTLIDVVRVDFKSAPVRVSHQGIVIEKGGKRYVRHAADRMFHRVVDEEIGHFFDRMSKYKKWPITGFHLARIEAPANWRELISAPLGPPAP